MNSGRIWAGLSFRNSLEGAEFVRKYDDISGAEGTLMEQNLQLITPLYEKLGSVKMCLLTVYCRARAFPSGAVHGRVFLTLDL